jgi:hypothetical protein
MEEKSQAKKSRIDASNVIAWIFIVLQICACVGLTYQLCSKGEKLSQIVTRGLLLPRAFFLPLVRSETPAVVELSGALFGYNILGIGAVILGLLIWLRRGNKQGRTTTIAAIVVIIINSLLYFGGYYY